MLFTPGPTNIPERVLKTMSRGSVHHRTAEFRELFLDCRKMFTELFEAGSEPIFLTCSGTGALEATLRAVASPGDTIAYVNGGKFGERWGKIAKALGLEALELSCEWGTSVTADQIDSVFAEHKNIVAFGIQHSETSTGVLHPIAQVREQVQKLSPETFFLVDAISSLGSTEIDFSHYDAIVSGSQKALMLPPGLATVNLSERAWEKAGTNDAGSLYFDLTIEKKTQAKGDGAWTPSIPLIFGLHEVLTMLKEEGLSKVYDRHRACAETTRRGLAELGFTTLSDDFPAPGVTPALPPEGVDPEELRQKYFSQTGNRIAGSQDRWKGKVIRIGHMGETKPAQIESLLSDLGSLL